MNVFTLTESASCPAPRAGPLLRSAPAVLSGQACRVNLILIGPRGQVGSAFRRHFQRQQGPLLAEAGLELRLVAAFDRRGFAFDVEGLPATGIERVLAPRSPGDTERLFAYCVRPGADRTLIIDCTASEQIADGYLGWLSCGVGVVGANKRANSRSLGQYRQLRDTALRCGSPYRYETTVGAAIPLLGPLRDLRLRGETVHSIRGVLSGSLSYILHRLHEGHAFSEAVDEAAALGYTEPDPMEDLRSTDLARKLLVLAREAGFSLEPAELQVGSLLPAGDAGGEDVISAQDATWREMVGQARQAGERWIMLAEADASGGRIGLQRVPEQSPFGRLLPGENLVQLRTCLQDRTPLSLCGPGAGAEITAAGVLSDVIAAAGQLASRRG